MRTRPSPRDRPWTKFDLGLSHFLANAARHPHGALDVRVGGVLIEKQDNLAIRALARKVVLQSSGAFAERGLALGAFDLNGVIHGKTLCLAC
jgi:hypothetical protein